MQINEAGIFLIKHFEGCKLTTYVDIAGINTIGYGHTGPEAYAGNTITQDAADRLLEEDLSKFSTGVERLITNRNLSANQFSAMVCFAYNIGLKNFKFSTLLRCVNKNNVLGAETEFLRWNKVKGIVVPGLVRRREAERILFKKE